MDVKEYIIQQFQELAKKAFPQGSRVLPVTQLTDLARFFVAGCFAFDVSENEGLEQLILEMTGEDWTPEDWHWDEQPFND